ncbi:hypothetical protein T484DRAFT_3293475 [Baffinella frigidus]|nr:hypothetical protein T484DRAFT_3293475 [Cryptophyta sp. CCMP2293]
MLCYARQTLHVLSSASLAQAFGSMMEAKRTPVREGRERLDLAGFCRDPSAPGGLM